jgi:hypothetical protein
MNSRKISQEKQIKNGGGGGIEDKASMIEES